LEDVLGEMKNYRITGTVAGLGEIVEHTHAFGRGQAIRQTAINLKNNNPHIGRIFIQGADAKIVPCNNCAH